MLQCKRKKSPESLHESLPGDLGQRQLPSPEHGITQNRVQHHHPVNGKWPSYEKYMNSTAL